MPNLLIIDDEPAICWALEQAGREMGCEVVAAASAEQALRLVDQRGPFDVVLLDVRLPGVDGLSSMPELRLRVGRAPIIVMTAFGDLATAMRAVEAGAFEYVLKPFDLAAIRGVVARALATRAAREAPPPAGDGAHPEMVGASPLMQEVFKRIALAARCEGPVILCGECGVGKSLAARTIHRHSARRSRPLVAVSAAGLPVGGSEAGVVLNGLWSQAAGGTMFLDDLDDLSLGAQAWLETRLKQDMSGRIEATAGAAPVRLMTAAETPPSELLRQGRLRADLAHRLGAAPITLPPLCERGGDVRLLAEYFCLRAGAGGRLSEAVASELAQRRWHGNVQELRVAIEHALTMAPAGPILPEHLPPPAWPARRQAGPTVAGSLLAAPLAPGGETLAKQLEQLATLLMSDRNCEGQAYEEFLQKVEPPLLVAALTRHHGQCAPAARALGLHRTTLKRKLQQYGLDTADRGDAPSDE